MGFGLLLNIDIDNTQGLLNNYLLGHYNLESSHLVLENAVIIVTKDIVHDMLGLPNDGEDFMLLPNCEKGNEILKECKNQYEKRV